MFLALGECVEWVWVYTVDRKKKKPIFVFVLTKRNLFREDKFALRQLFL